MVNQSRVLSLVAQWEEAREGGTPVPVEDVCGDSPEYVGPVREVISKLHGGAALSAGVHKPASNEPVAPPGYELHEKVGQGGMGVVYRAYHRALDRDIALKFLLPKYATGSPTARQFLDEAKITAKLQHPGIPTIHEVGELANGRPYLAMKLIRGKTLAALLKEQGHGGAKWLGVFEAICQAVGAAHAAGYIHRDLKPGNVMVGAFGEVQVMDWGLAKKLPDDQRRNSSDRTPNTAGPVTGSADDTSPAAEDSSARNTDRTIPYASAEGEDDGTREGEVKGTVSYMPPEQASGDIDRIDRRADVFALGAILCEILTGKPPLSGSVMQVLGNCIAGNFGEAHLRLDECGEDRELIALARWCLRVSPADRPADSSDVASAVATFRAATEARAKKAEVERAEAAVQVVEQRRRQRQFRWAASIVGAVLTLGIIGTAIGMGVAIVARKAEKDRADGEMTQTKLKEEQRVIAVEKTKLAEDKNTDLWNSLDSLTADIVGDTLGTQKAVSDQQRQFLDTVLPLYRKLASEAGNDEKTRDRVAQATHRVGTIESRLGRIGEGATAFGQARDEYAKLAAEFPAVLEYRAKLASSHANLGNVLMELGQWKEAADQYRESILINKKFVAEFAAVPDYRSKLASGHTNLGLLLTKLGNRVEAAEQFQKALAINEQLAAEFPAAPVYRDRLGKNYTALGYHSITILNQQTEAVEYYRKGIAIQDRLATDFPPVPDYRSDLARSYSDLSAILFGLGKLAEAEDQSGKAIRVLEKLAVEFPAVPEYRQVLAGSHANLGVLLINLGRRADAEAQFQKGLATREKLVADHPNVSEYKQDLGGSYLNFGVLVRDGGKLPDSLAWFDKAITNLRPIHEAEPRAVTAKQFLRNCYRSRAKAYDQSQKYAEAVKDWDQAVELSPMPEQPQFRASRATSKVNAWQVAEAITETDELRKLPGWDEDDWYGFACVYSLASGKIAEKKAHYATAAVEMLQKAVKAGYKDAAHMKKDTDLDPLRDRDDFKQLLADLEKKFPPKREVLPQPRREK